MTVTTFTESYDVKTRFFDQINLAYYPTENWKAFVGHRYLGGRNAIALGSEFAQPLGGGVVGSLFVEARFADHDFPSIWGGLRFYFGQSDTPLIARHRRDDPPIWSADSLFSILNNHSTSASGVSNQTSTSATSSSSTQFCLPPRPFLVGGFCEVSLCCFTATTQVLMADGSSRPIAAVKIGDQVLGENGEINRVIDIETPVLGHRKLYAFNDGPAFVTPEHPFVTRAGWKSIAPEATFAENNNLSVGALKVGDELVKLGKVMARAEPISVAYGGMVQAPSVEVQIETKFSAIESMTPHDGDASMTVYNLRLDGNHTYFANDYLVHNK
jgi:Hom_end-associated Hint